MPKRHTTIRFTERTNHQINELTAWGFGNQTEVILIAIDRMHREEKARCELAELDRLTDAQKSGEN